MSITRIDEIDLDTSTLFLSGLNEGDILISNNGQIVGKTETLIIQPEKNRAENVEGLIRSDLDTLTEQFNIHNHHEHYYTEEEIDNRFLPIETKLYREDNNEHLHLKALINQKALIKLFENNPSQSPGNYGFILQYNGNGNDFSIKSHVNGVDTDRLLIPRNNNTKIQLLNSGLLTSKLLTLNANNEIESSNYSDTDISNLDGRLSSTESNISSNDTDISALDGRLSITETNISTNDTDISNLDGRLSTAESNISNLDTRLTTTETNIITNITDISALQININTEISNRISADNLVDTRLDSLENDIVNQSLNQLGNKTCMQIDFTGGNNHEIKVPYSAINNHGDCYLKVYGISRSNNSGSEKNEILSGLLRFSFSPSSTRIFEQYKRKSNSNQPMFYIECVYPNIIIFCRPYSSYSPYTSVFVEIYSNRSVTFSEPVVVDLGSNVVLSLNSNTTNYIDLYGTLKIPQLLSNKLLYLDSNNEIKSSIYTDSDITNLQINISSNDTDISNLDGRLSITETNISTNDTDISNLDGRLSITETNISSNLNFITNNYSNIQLIEQITQDLTRSGTTLSNYELESSINLSIYQSDTTVPVKLDFKRGSSNFGSDVYTDYRLMDKTGDFYLQQANNNNIYDIFTIKGSNRKIQLPQLIPNNILYLDSSQQLTSSTLSHSDLLNIIQYQSTSTSATIFQKGITIEGEPNPTLHIKSNSTNSQEGGELIFSESDINWGYKISHNGLIDDLIIYKMSGSTTSEILKFNSTEIQLPQLTSNKILYLNSNNELKSSTRTHTELEDLFNNNTNTTTTKTIVNGEEGGISMVEPGGTYGMKMKYTAQSNLLQIIRLYNGLETPMLTFERDSMNIKFNQIPNPNNSNLLYLDSNKVMKTCSMFYNETSDIFEIDKSIQITSAAQGFKLEGGTQGFSSLTHLYGYRFFNTNGTVESYYSNNECKVIGDIIGTNNLIINGDITTGYIKLETTSTTSFHMQHYQIEQYNTDISDTLPIMRIGHDNGRITTNTVYYKYPTSLYYHFTQLNGGLYQNTADQNNNSRTNAVWGRYSDNYSLNAYRNIKVNGSIVQTSDERIKKNIKKNVKPSLDIINAIDIYQYEYKDRNEPETTGFIAQQMKTVDEKYNTDFVDTHDEQTCIDQFEGIEKVLNVKKDKLYPHLVGSIKELTNKIHSLEDEIVKLKIQNAELLSTTDYSLNERLTLIEKQLAEVDISKYF